MEKKYRVKKRTNDYSKLSNIKPSALNIKSLFKFNLFNTIIVTILIYMAIVGFSPSSSLTIFKSPSNPSFLPSIFKFIFIAAVVLTLLGWLVMAYYKRLDKES